MALSSIFTGLPGYDQELDEPTDSLSLPAFERPPSSPSAGDAPKANGLESLVADLEARFAPAYERSLPGEAASSFLRGAVPGALEVTGQALRGLGAESAGTALKSAGETVRGALPSLFRPSDTQVPGSFKNIVSSAFESVGTSLAISAPAMAAAVATGGGATPVMLAYILSTPGVFGAAEYQNFLDEARKAEIPDEVSRAPAVLSALAEAGFELAGNTVESLLIAKGFSRLAANGMKGKLRQGIKAVMTPKLREVATDIAATGVSEGVTEGLTEIAQEQLREGVGIESGPSNVFTAASSGALAGLMFGGMGKTLTGVVRRSELRTLASPTAEPGERLNAIDRVVERLHEAPEGDIDQETITAFQDYATQAVRQGQEIPLGQDISGPGSVVQPEPQEVPAAPSPMVPIGTTAQRAATVIAPPAPGTSGVGIFGDLIYQPPPPIPASAPTVMDLLRGQVAPATEPTAPKQPMVPMGETAQRAIPLAQPELPLIESGPGEALQPGLPTEAPVSMALPPTAPAAQKGPLEGTGIEPVAPVASPPLQDFGEAQSPGQAVVPPTTPSPVPESSPPPLPEGEGMLRPTQGLSSEYFTPSGRSYPFTYELVEASEAIPSHNPQTFSPNPLYEDVSGLPLGELQDRPYHRDQAEQAKVIEQDRKFAQRFWFMLSDSPDATNGPPIVAADSNVVLGGNSRMMTILRKASEQNPEAYQAYRDGLKERAAQFGLDPTQIDQMQAPVLVRRLNEVSTNDPQAMKAAARETNESFTQALSEKAQAVASGKALSDDTVTYLSQQLDAMGEETTLREFFRTAASRELIRRLQDDGVLTQRTINRYTDREGQLNHDGQALVERSILGRVLPDSDLIDAAPPSMVNTLIKALPAITQLQARGEAWDISRHLREAVKLATDTKLNGWRSVEEHLKQQSLFGEANPNPIAVSLANRFLEARQLQTKRSFDAFAAAANRDVAGQSAFTFVPVAPPWTAFNQAFGAELTPETYQEAQDVEGRPEETQQFQAKGKTSSQGGGQPWELTLSEVEAAFPAQRVLAIPGGGFRVETPAGYVDMLEVDQIQMGPQERLAFELGYGQPFSEDVSAAGRLVNQQGQSRIELVKGAADRVTLLHEVEHWIEHSGLLTPDEVQRLSEATGKENASAEDRAEWVAGQLNDRRYRRDTAVGRVLDRVWDYLDRLLSLVGLQTTRGIVRAIERGEVVNRTENIPKIFLNNDNSQKSQQFQAYTRPADVERENKLYSEYLGWANMVGPELTKIFEDNNISFLKQRISVKQMSEFGRQVADSWTETPSRMTKVLNDFTKNHRPPSTEEIEALKELGYSMADVLVQAKREGKMTDEEFFDRFHKMLGPTSVFATFNGIASELARSMRMLQEKPPTQRFFDLMVERRKRLGEFVDDQQIKDYEAAFSKVLLDGNTDEIARFLGGIEAESPRIWQYLKEYWYGSVLSGFPTQIANGGGNILWGYFSLGVIKPLEALVDPFVAQLQNRPRQRFMSEVFPALAGLTRGYLNKERYSAVIAGLKTGEFDMPGISGIGKFERDIGNYASVWQHATWQLDFPTMRKLGLDVGKARRVLKSTMGIEPGQPINFMRTVAPFVSMATRAMVGFDLLGKAAVRDATIASLSERQVRMELESGSLNQNQATARRMELITRANDQADAMGRDMNEQAMVEAAKLTFNDEPSAIAKLILQGRRLPFWGKPLQMIFPFVATPDRLITRAIQLVPGLGILPYMEVALNAKGSGVEATALVARQMAGLALFTMIWGLFEAGLTTGDVPDDPNERDAFFRAGKQPWSINVGGYYVSYRRFEPLNLVLGMPAVLIPALKKVIDSDNQEDAISIAVYGASVLGRQVLEGSYFSGLQGLIQALGRGSSPERQEGSMSRLVDSWIPYTGMRRSIVRAIDAYETDQGAIVRSPQSFFENITGASLVTDIQARRDVWGRPIVIPGTVASQFIPWRVSAANRDPVEQELARFEIFPGPPSQQDAKGKKLSQTDYDYLVAQGGAQAKASLDRLVRQPLYQSLSPELREQYLRRAIRNAREAARDELARRSRARGLVAGGAG